MLLTVFLSCLYLGVPILIASLFLQGRPRQATLALSAVVSVVGATEAAFAFLQRTVTTEGKFSATPPW